MPRIVNTDNFGRDYPDEQFVSGVISQLEAEELANKLNGDELGWSSRCHKIVPDDYTLAPEVEP